MTPKKTNEHCALSWLELIGRHSQEPLLIDKLTAAGVEIIPPSKRDNSDVWVHLDRCALVFTDESEYPKRRDLDDGMRVLSGVAIPVRDDDGQVLEDPLPFGVNADDSPDQVKARFGERVDEVEDEEEGGYYIFERGNLWLNVNYSPGMKNIMGLVVSLPLSYDEDEIPDSEDLRAGLREDTDQAPLNINELLGQLGECPDKPALRELMTRCRIHRAPEVELDEDGDIVHPRDFLIARRRGIQFTFEHEAALRGEEPDGVGPEHMRLVQVCLYRGHPGVLPYTQGPLPYGIEFDDDRATVRRKLEGVDARLRSGERDTWAFPECTLVVTYDDDEQGLSSVLCMLPRPALAPLDVEMFSPELDELIARLGCELHEPEMQPFLDQLGLSELKSSAKEPQVARLGSLIGLDLHFGGDKRFPETALTDLFLFRERRHGARQWAGALPQGLSWDDSPDTLFEKLGDPAQPPYEGAFEGLATWDFETFSLGVYFDTVQNWIVSVRLQARLADSDQADADG